MPAALEQMSAEKLEEKSFSLINRVLRVLFFLSIFSLKYSRLVCFLKQRRFFVFGRPKTGWMKQQNSQILIIDSQVEAQVLPPPPRTPCVGGSSATLSGRVWKNL